MKLSFNQMFEKVLREVGEPMGTPPAAPSPGGMGAAPPGMPPMPGGAPGMPPAGGMPPAMPGGPMPGAAPAGGSQQPPPEIQATDWVDFMEKALNKLEGKPTSDDNTKQKGKQDADSVTPPPESQETGAEMEPKVGDPDQDANLPMVQGQ